MFTQMYEGTFYSQWQLLTMYVFFFIMLKHNLWKLIIDMKYLILSLHNFIAFIQL